MAGPVPCSIVEPCGNTLWVYHVLPDALIYACINQHHHRVGAPPPQLRNAGQPKAGAKDPLKTALRNLKKERKNSRTPTCAMRAPATKAAAAGSR
jgi:hypothetical protein